MGRRKSQNGYFPIRKTIKKNTLNKCEKYNFVQEKMKLKFYKIFLKYQMKKITYLVNPINF